MYVQPFDAIKNYFGEKIGLYFAFMGYYLFFLTFMAVLGITTFIYGVTVSTTGKSTYLNELETDEKLLCPQCNQFCDYKPLSSTYDNARFTYWFDNFGSFLYACIVPIFVRVQKEVFEHRF